MHIFAFSNHGYYLFEFYEPRSRVNKPGDSSHCDEHAGASSQTESPEADSDNDEDSAENDGDTASRDSALMEQSLEQDDDTSFPSITGFTTRID